MVEGRGDWHTHCGLGAPQSTQRLFSFVFWMSRSLLFVSGSTCRHVVGTRMTLDGAAMDYLTSHILLLILMVVAWTQTLELRLSNWCRQETEESVKTTIQAEKGAVVISFPLGSIVASRRLNIRPPPRHPPSTAFLLLYHSLFLALTPTRLDLHLHAPITVHDSCISLWTTIRSLSPSSRMN